jgi:DNA-binding MarR family transcriptional regulator
MEDRDAAQVASELRVVLGRLTRRLRAEYTFSLSQAAVLGRLSRDGQMTTSALAQAERVRPQSMAQTLADLEADGLVDRSPDPTDRRQTLIGLTGRGREILEQDRRRRDGWLAETIAAELTVEEQSSLGELVEILKKLVR